MKERRTRSKTIFEGINRLLGELAAFLKSGYTPKIRNNSRIKEAFIKVAGTSGNVYELLAELGIRKENKQKICSINSNLYLFVKGIKKIVEKDSAKAVRVKQPCRSQSISGILYKMPRETAAKYAEQIIENLLHGNIVRLEDLQELSDAIIETHQIIDQAIIENKMVDDLKKLYKGTGKDENITVLNTLSKTVIPADIDRVIEFLDLVSKTIERMQESKTVEILENLEQAIIMQFILARIITKNIFNGNIMPIIELMSNFHF